MKTENEVTESPKTPSKTKGATTKNSAKPAAKKASKATVTKKRAAKTENASAKKIVGPPASIGKARSEYQESDCPRTTGQERWRDDGRDRQSNGLAEAQYPWVYQRTCHEEDGAGGRVCQE
jgi:hypothetical protein